MPRRFFRFNAILSALTAVPIAFVAARWAARP